MNIEIVEAYDRLIEVRALFAEYLKWLGLPLDFQNFNEEVASLPGQYARPGGRLYLALAGGVAAGCVALRPYGEKEGLRQCEMKRLFVCDGFRGLGLGRLLAERVIADARAIGYREMLLDSLASMERAVSLYQRLGFEKTGAYRYNPYENALYFRLRLL